MASYEISCEGGCPMEKCCADESASSQKYRKCYEKINSDNSWGQSPFSSEGPSTTSLSICFHLI